mgnify:CR=1 FL=1
MKRKLIYLFIALAATILPAHAQKFLNDALAFECILMATRKLALCRHDGRHGKPNHRLGT